MGWDGTGHCRKVNLMVIAGPEGDVRKRRLTARQISELDDVFRRNAVEESEQCRRADSGWNCEDSFVNAGTKRNPLADADDNDHPLETLKAG
ncbi:hypothetical protein HYFRA_00009975 [Hymenoscyphus fraxineus]|uniref:Uncharacterized protein n=1 Tax=Hymenoscyphus fraxineus TaxID=746836 RepID=A0A9N9KVR8_9HELO|nr:hypothetical protein HYFRA_00009975 [Hymenoscyphus fraxineus]